MKQLWKWIGCTALLAGLSGEGAAQSVTLQPTRPGPVISRTDRANMMELAETRLFYLRNATSQNEQNEIVTALRNMLDPANKIFLVPSARAILVRADVSELELAAHFLTEVDKSPLTYRLTYTFAEKEGAKTLGQQHFNVEMTAGQRVQAKGGNRLPIAVGPTPNAEPGSASQVTYIDVGLSVDATADEVVNGLRLRNKIERSAVAEERSSASVGGDPVIRQSLIEGTVVIPFGKAVVVGSLDVPGSPRTIEVSVVAEAAK